MIISFYSYKPNAVALGKSYLIIVFVINLLVVLNGEYESSGFGSLPNLLSGLVWSVIWFWYLCQSEQVKSLFPKNERKMFKRDKVLLFLIVAPVIIWLISIFVFAFTQGFVEQTQINNSVINEKTLSTNDWQNYLNFTIAVSE